MVEISSSPAPAPVARPPYRDTAPADDGEPLVTILRSGVELSDGRQCAVGDVVRVAANDDSAAFCGELRGTAEFPPIGVSAQADEVCGLVKSGVVSSLSVGFDILDSTPLDPKQPRGGLRISRADLLEISLVSVPADSGALITERSLSMRDQRAGTKSIMPICGRRCSTLRPAMKTRSRRYSAAGRCTRARLLPPRSAQSRPLTNTQA
jgi:hypothetical protein